MTARLRSLPPAIAASLATWHRIVTDRKTDELASIVHPQAVFRSPVAHSPYDGAGALILAIGTVLEVFEDFTYHRELATDDGASMVLEFSARVRGRELKGIDLIRFDDTGRIVEFEVMVRPLSGLQALKEEMGARVGEKLAAFKAGG